MMWRAELSGRAALVTGAASGIGLATATMLAEAGCAVALNFLPGDPRGAEAAARLRATTQVQIVEAPGSVSDAGASRAMVAAAIAALGRLDFLVNNAGTPATPTAIAPEELDRITEELWATVLETNLVGVFRVAQAAAAALREARGAVVNVASIAGFGYPGSSLAYGASKAGVVNLTVNLARALAPEVRVNAVAPGAVDSTWPLNWTEARREETRQKALLKRRCTPEDIAEAIVFLLAGGGMVTGQTLVVDGGLTL
jgi:3-oxoacyl-[acyl-carrier protein] reductase